jgi:hypothetical protein
MRHVVPVRAEVTKASFWKIVIELTTVLKSSPKRLVGGLNPASFALATLKISGLPQSSSKFGTLFDVDKI